MKISCLALALLVLNAIPVVFAQDFSLDALVTTGAGQSSGGVYSLEGHIGHFHPARIAAADYILETDIFGSPVDTIPSEVQLLASYSNGSLTLLWDRAAAGFQLETAGSLGSAAPWSAVTVSAQSNATHFFVSVPATSEHQFFRLRRP